ncbi:hypothetical protein [Ralstonia wenshanensis]|jgi:uncharacterized protein (DUF1778 family)|uniref:CopG-like ribbon-helix-helix domain-containing protein n=1 Tax=Ralstonia wenshanensis TaxID=2842456 RepID=A0AAD2B206_9RALS|nr:hypothetical protein [Ralstonia wenshanensis]CAJ0699140.1 hypothetical protein LMG18091_02860 [Ralstonia wenshanensis]
MVEGKNISMSFRVSSRFKGLLEAAAENEHRSLTNMLETLLYAHCEKYGIELSRQLNAKKAEFALEGGKQ